MTQTYLMLTTFFIIFCPFINTLNNINETVLKNCWSEEEFYQSFSSFEPSSDDILQDEFLQMLKSKYIQSNPNLFMKKGEENLLFHNLYDENIIYTGTEHTPFIESKSDILRRVSSVSEFGNTNTINPTTMQNANTNIKHPNFYTKTEVFSQNLLLNQINSKYLKHYGIDMSGVREDFDSNLTEIENEKLDSSVSPNVDKYPEFYSLYTTEFNIITEPRLVKLYNFFLHNEITTKKDKYTLQDLRKDFWKRINRVLNFPRVLGCVKFEENKKKQIGFVVQSISSLDFFMSMRGAYQWVLSKIFLDISESLLFSFSKNFTVYNLSLDDIGVLTTKLDSNDKRFHAVFKNINKLRTYRDKTKQAYAKLESSTRLVHIFFEAVNKYHSEIFTADDINLQDCIKNKSHFNMLEKCPVIIWSILDQDVELKKWFETILRISTNKGLRPEMTLEEITKLITPEDILFGFGKLLVEMIKMKDEIRNVDNGYGWGFFGDLTREANILIRETQQDEDSDELMGLMEISEESSQKSDIISNDRDEDIPMKIRLTDDISDSQIDTYGHDEVGSIHKDNIHSAEQPSLVESKPKKLVNTSLVKSKSAHQLNSSQDSIKLYLRNDVKRKIRKFKNVTKVLSTMKKPLFNQSYTQLPELGVINLDNKMLNHGEDKVILYKSHTENNLLHYKQLQPLERHKVMLQKSIVPINKIRFTKVSDRKKNKIILPDKLNKSDAYGTIKISPKLGRKTFINRNAKSFPNLPKIVINDHSVISKQNSKSNFRILI